MANKTKKTLPKPVPQSNAGVLKKDEKTKFSFKLEIPSLPGLTPYLPGILLFFLALAVGLLTYQDYGIAWDEPAQRAPGLLSYNYIFYGDQELFTTPNDNHGAGFEVLLVLFEKWKNLTDLRDIYQMRHIVTHVFFLVSVFCAYVLIYRLFKNKFLACLGFIMLLFAPRLYAHSFFNSKDMPFLFMFLITLAACQVAFEKNKPLLFLGLGVLCGYATSIRIMGVMLGAIILLFLFIDLATDLVNKKNSRTPILNILLFSAGFIIFLYLGWPYLWESPIARFIDSFNKLAHFDLVTEVVLINGKYISASKLPWTYFPAWFIITNPELWLFAGFAGILLLGIGFFRKPLTYLKNTRERNFLLYFLCFLVPVLAVIILHSIIYDDWRHLYFVYPSFVLLALYFINKLLQTRYKAIVQAACMLQLVLTGTFMVSSHPFNQVYFNNFVSHAPEYLRKNYDLEYWGCGFKQGLDHVLNTDKSKIIKINCDFPILLDNGIMSLHEDDRQRIQFADKGNADYLFTNFRGHPYDYPSYKTEYAVKVLNSSVLSVFRLEKDTAKQRQFTLEDISILSKFLAMNPDNEVALVNLGYYFFSVSRYDSAEFYDTRVTRLYPNNSMALDNLVTLYVTLKKFPETLQTLKKCIKVNPKDAEKYLDVGSCFLALNKYDSALYYYYKGAAMDPQYNNISYGDIAITYKKSGNPDSAKKYEAIAQKYNPGFRL